MTQKDWKSHLSLFGKVCVLEADSDMNTRFFGTSDTDLDTGSDMHISENLGHGFGFGHDFGHACPLISALHNNFYLGFRQPLIIFVTGFRFCIGHVCGLLITVLKSDGLVSILIVNKTVREYLLVHLSPFYQSFYSSCTSSRTPCYSWIVGTQRTFILETNDLFGNNNDLLSVTREGSLEIIIVKPIYI